MTTGSLFFVLLLGVPAQGQEEKKPPPPIYYPDQFRDDPAVQKLMRHRLQKDPAFQAQTIQLQEAEVRHLRWDPLSWEVYQLTFDLEGSEAQEVVFEYSTDGGKIWHEPRGITGLEKSISPGKDKKVHWNLRQDLPVGRSQVLVRVETRENWQKRVARILKQIPMNCFTRPDRKAGDSCIDFTSGVDFVWVPGGTFDLGCGPWAEPCSDDEKPLQKDVRVEGFWLSKYEVTQGEWEAQGMKNDSRFKGIRHPVENVSWYDAMDFIHKLNVKAGDSMYRLPTEAEWEYAARDGGKEIKYPWGDEDPVCQKGAKNGAMFRDDKECNATGSEPAGSYEASDTLKLHDMAGNVWEWTCSLYTDNYSTRAYDRSCESNSQANSQDNRHVLRGGSWYYVSRLLRAAKRLSYRPDDRGGGYGLRLVRLPQD